jgi:hypothetical protein
VPPASAGCFCLALSALFEEWSWDDGRSIFRTYAVPFVFGTDELQPQCHCHQARRLSPSSLIPIVIPFFTFEFFYVSSSVLRKSICLPPSYQWVALIRMTGPSICIRQNSFHTEQFLKAGPLLSRRDYRTQPGVSTPGTRQHREPPSQGASYSSSSSSSSSNPATRSDGVLECGSIAPSPNCTRVAGWRC